MIATLLFTIVIEATVVIGYRVWHRKPIWPILITSICVNLITQVLLWGVLNVFFQHYLIALWISEALIWILEGLVLCYVPANRLRLDEALFLSLGMNMLSFALGWFLPT